MFFRSCFVSRFLFSCWAVFPLPTLLTVTMNPFGSLDPAGFLAVQAITRNRSPNVRVWVRVLLSFRFAAILGSPIDDSCCSCENQVGRHF